MTPVKDVSVITCWLSVDSVQFSSSSAVVPVAAFTIGFGETAASFSLLKINAELTQPATTQDRGGCVRLRLIQSSPDTILVSRRGLPCNITEALWISTQTMMPLLLSNDMLSFTAASVKALKAENRKLS